MNMLRNRGESFVRKRRKMGLKPEQKVEKEGGSYLSVERKPFLKIREDCIHKLTKKEAIAVRSGSAPDPLVRDENLFTKQHCILLRERLLKRFAECKNKRSIYGIKDYNIFLKEEKTSDPLKIMIARELETMRHIPQIREQKEDEQKIIEAYIEKYPTLVEEKCSYESEKPTAKKKGEKKRADVAEQGGGLQFPRQEAGLPHRPQAGRLLREDMKQRQVLERPLEHESGLTFVDERFLLEDRLQAMSVQAKNSEELDEFYEISSKNVTLELRPLRQVTPVSLVGFDEQKVARRQEGFSSDTKKIQGPWMEIINLHNRRRLKPPKDGHHPYTAINRFMRRILGPEKYREFSQTNLLQEGFRRAPVTRFLDVDAVVAAEEKPPSRQAEMQSECPKCHRSRRVLVKMSGKPHRKGPPEGSTGRLGKDTSREETMGKPQKAPSREETMGKPQKVPSKEKPMGKPHKAPSKEKQMRKSHKVPSKEKQMRKSHEKPSKEEPMGKPQNAPSKEEPMGKPLKVPSKEKPMGKHQPSKEARRESHKAPSKEEPMGKPPKEPEFPTVKPVQSQPRQKKRVRYASRDSIIPFVQNVYYFTEERSQNPFKVKGQSVYHAQSSSNPPPEEQEVHPTRIRPLSEDSRMYMSRSGKQEMEEMVRSVNYRIGVTYFPQRFLKERNKQYVSKRQAKQDESRLGRKISQVPSAAPTTEAIPSRESNKPLRHEYEPLSSKSESAASKALESASLHSSHESMPSKPGSLHSRHESIPSKPGSLHLSYESIPSKSESLHSSHESIPSKSESLHSSHESIPSKSESLHSSHESIPSKSESLHSSHEYIPSKSESLHSSHEPIPSKSESLHSSHEPIPSKSESLHSSHESIPSKSESLHSSHESIPSKSESLHSRHEPIPSKSESLHSRHEPIPSKSESLHSSHESKPSKSASLPLKTLQETSETLSKDPQTPAPSLKHFTITTSPIPHDSLKRTKSSGAREKKGKLMGKAIKGEERESMESEKRGSPPTDGQKKDEAGKNWRRRQTPKRRFISSVSVDEGMEVYDCIIVRVGGGRQRRKRGRRRRCGHSDSEDSDSDSPCRRHRSRHQDRRGGGPRGCEECCVDCRGRGDDRRAAHKGKHQHLEEDTDSSNDAKQKLHIKDKDAVEELLRARKSKPEDEPEIASLKDIDAEDVDHDEKKGMYEGVLQDLQDMAAKQRGTDGKTPDPEGLAQEKVFLYFSRGFRPDHLCWSGEVCFLPVTHHRKQFVLRSKVPDGAIHFTANEEPLRFLTKLGFNIDEAAFSLNEAGVSKRLRAALNEARVWVQTVSVNQGTLLYFLSVKADDVIMRYYPQLVEAVVNYRVTDAVKLDALMRTLKDIEAGIIKLGQEYFLKKKHSGLTRDDVMALKRIRKIFFLLFQIAEEECQAARSRHINQYEIAILRLLSVKNVPGLFPHYDLLARYIGQGLLRTEVQLEAATVYLSRLQPAEVRLIDFEDYIGITSAHAPKTLYKRKVVDDV